MLSPSNNVLDETQVMLLFQILALEFQYVSVLLVTAAVTTRSDEERESSVHVSTCLDCQNYRRVVRPSEP